MFFGKESVSKYRLLPLREEDVLLAARESNVNSGDFLRCLRKVNGGPLASLPLTLGMLIEELKETGTLPASASRLYRTGCRRLLLHGRDALCSHESTNIDSRYACSSAFAALVLFCGKTAVSKKQGESMGPGDLVVEGLDVEPDWAKAALEALETPLFTSMANARFQFAHRSFAEFLASGYLLERVGDSGEILRLLSVMARSDEVAIAPQFGGVAAWLAQENAEFRKELAKSEPQVALQAGGTEIPEEERGVITVALLNQLQRFERTEPSGQLARRYGLLAHKGIVTQLRPYLPQAEKSPARKVAIEIAGYCRVSELLPVLLEITEDRSEQPYLRILAAEAVFRTRDRTSAERLLKAVSSRKEPPESDDLRARVLQELWERNWITPQQLFRHLGLPRPRRLGNYWHLMYKLRRDLDSRLLPHALEWASGVCTEKYLDPSVAEFLGDIICLAARQLDLFGNKVSSIVLRCLQNGIVTKVPDDVVARRGLLCLLVPQLGDVGKHAHHLRRWIHRDDFKWSLEIAAKSQADATAKTWCTVARLATGVETADECKALLNAADNSQVVAQYFDSLLRPVELNSRVAKGSRRDWAEGEWARQPSVEKLTDDELNVCVKDRVRLVVQNGQFSAFTEILDLLTSEALDSQSHALNERDPTELPAWPRLHHETRCAVMKAAECVILEADPETDEWWRDSRTPISAWSAYCALVLVCREKRALDQLPQTVWKKWAGVVITLGSFASGEGSSEAADHIGGLPSGWR
jgi:hypothetical protein